MFWLGLFSKDILADVNENKEIPVIFCTINKNLKILETFAESSRKRPSSIVYYFGRLREPIFLSDKL